MTWHTYPFLFYFTLFSYYISTGPYRKYEMVGYIIIKDIESRSKKGQYDETINFPSSRSNFLRCIRETLKNKKVFLRILMMKKLYSFHHKHMLYIYIKSI
jgi:hypothetical protein